MELLVRYLERTDRTVFVLIRAENHDHAAERLRQKLVNVCGATEPYADHVVALAGGLTRAGLGLDETTAAGVPSESPRSFTGAASVSFDLALEPSRLVNVEGTRQMLAVAGLCCHRGGLGACPTSRPPTSQAVRGAVHERDLEAGQRFRNASEQSKYEAEQLVARYRERLPITVLRPSVIVGDSQSGWTA